MQIIKSKVFKNFSYLTIGNVFSQIVGVFALLKIANIFSPSDYGTFTFMLVQSQLLISIGDLGIQKIIIRTIARNNEKTKELIKTGLILKIFSVFIVALLYYVYNYFFGSLTTDQLLIIFCFSLINCGMNLFDSIFIGHQKMIFTSLVNVIISLVWLICIFALPWELISVNLLFIIYLFLHFLKTSTLFILLKVNGLIIGNNLSFKKSSIELLKQSWPYFSLVLFLLPVNYLSNNFLDMNSTAEEIGYFNLSQRLIQPVNVIIGFALVSIFPNISALWIENKLKFNMIISKGFFLFFLGAIFLTISFSIFSKELIMLIFDDKYYAAIKVAQIQIWFVFLMSINSVIGSVFGATNQEKLVFKTSLVNALIATPLLYFGSMYGAIGIAYAYVVSFAIFEVYLWSVFTKYVEMKFNFTRPLWIFAITAFCISSFLIDNISILLKGVVYLIFLLLFLWFVKTKIFNFRFDVQ